MNPMLAFLPMGISPGEMLIVGVIALLLFGKRLPEVARSLGKGVTEFKKGIKGIEDDVDQASYTRSTSSTARPLPADEREPMTAPKFEPPTSAPVAADEHHA